ncbi:MAG: aminotransferase class V-fold PLP-dependent enzyme [Oscillospiraceae bacterium]|nr:aminotransferase class V-fold PLP-dependent enzyme [Oscillospiraceae bacterium]MDD4367641.1 aminotransferase class V-fold PLP-dependent enzyme [Oscillospiraceae bacterium]
MIYLDNAATTLAKPDSVARAMTAALTGQGSSGRSAHPAALAASRSVFRTRVTLAALLGVSDPARICFSANITEALNLALNGSLQPGAHVISTDWEHNSVLRPLYRLREQGVALDFVPADLRGRLDASAWERLLRPETRAVVCTQASNVTGDQMDLAAVAAFCHRHGLRLIVDGAQGAGLLPVDLEGQGWPDIYCFTGHKALYGPQGTGGLAIQKGVDIKPWNVGGSGVDSFNEQQPQDYPVRLEAGTLNGPGLAGLAAGARYVTEQTPARLLGQASALAQLFYRQLSPVPALRFYGDFSCWPRVPVLAMNIAGFDSGLVADLLADRYGIAIRSGIHCAPRLHRALGTASQGALRFSWSSFNTEEETRQAVRAVRELAADLTGQPAGGFPGSGGV